MRTHQVVEDPRRLAERERLRAMFEANPDARLSNHGRHQKIGRVSHDRVGAIVQAGMCTDPEAATAGNASKRLCQGAWPLDKAIRLIRKGRGHGGPTGERAER